MADATRSHTSDGKGRLRRVTTRRWQGLASGSRDAVGEVLTVYDPLIVKTVRRYLGADRFERDGEDVLQTIRLAVASKARGLRKVTHQVFVAWLRQVVRSQIIDWERHRRSKRRQPTLPLVSLDRTGGPQVAARDATPSCRLRRREQVELLSRAISKVPERYQDVLRFMLERARTPAEITAFTGKTPAAARVFLVRGLRHLRAALGTGSSSL